ncbi:Peroxyureidoacrylate/ureidoacrylate amidohydrolase RutB [Austwickia sp. TVS 96-490-7B]|uniref:isochorismatase family protein n=1 Tax=Austwickia sp. TVS 96-490-7B TaxID=2830843 RepID=UPI001C584B1D|nr:isochorismatase family protein [Austwickia sp. TVS 96-490-7B]MBW3084113.1 Peroxyureidoacrylate/ureidoacrylate amidohydrolase RutB [Austwickia sp. TVS 96-490-7B]
MSDTVVLVVDVQRDVMAESVRAAEVIDTIAGLVDRARAADVPVMWVRHHSDDLPMGSPGWEIVDQLHPAEHETVVEKEYGDAFAATDLSDRLAALGAQTIVLCGAQSDACIRSTFYGGLYHGYQMKLVSDAHTTGDLRQWGAEFTPEQSIAMLNLYAAYTKLPDVEGATVTAAEAISR